MNSDARRIFSHLDNRRNLDFNPPIYPGFYHVDNLRDRFAGNPAILVPALVLFATVLYQAAAHQNHQLPPLPQLLWDILVWLIPARLLFAVDNWLNPPLFPLPPMLQQTQTATRTHTAKSEVLRKLLGVDHGGSIMRSVSQAGRKSLNTLSGSTLGLKGSEQPPGLGNLDNSCYQNSILQGLAALKPLPPYLAGLALGGLGQKKHGVARTTDTLRDLIHDLNDADNNGRTLWTPSVLKNMSTWQQQDAQEYYSKLLDEIDKEIAKAAKELQRPTGFESDSYAGSAKDDSTSSQHSDDSGYQSLSTTLSKAGSEAKTIRNPLEGLTAQRVACVACGWSEGLSMIPFNCLTLNLGAQAQHDLYERLDSYTKVEFIEGVDCIKCTLKKYKGLLTTIIERSRQAGNTEAEFPEPYARLKMIDDALEEDDFSDETLKRCKIQNRVSSMKTKQTVVARPPQSLAIHVNRSVFDESTGAMYKNFANVQFPLTLDLGPWCLGSADTLTAVSKGQTAAAATTGDTTVATEDMKGDAAAPAEAASPIEDEEQWVLDATKSMVAGDRHPSKITGPIYELRAVVTHQGRHENGHYVCYRRHLRSFGSTMQHSGEEKSDQPPQLAAEVHEHDDEEAKDGPAPQEAPGDDQKPESDTTPADDGYGNSQWWRLSDQNVYQVDEDAVLAQGGVFMLFYDCVDPNSILTSELTELPEQERKTTLVGGEVGGEAGIEEVALSLEQVAQLIEEGDGKEELQTVDVLETTQEVASDGPASSTTTDIGH